jgi:hypothetical protein
MWQSKTRLQTRQRCALSCLVLRAVPTDIRFALAKTKKSSKSTDVTRSHLSKPASVTPADGNGYSTGARSGRVCGVCGATLRIIHNGPQHGSTRVLFPNHHPPLSGNTTTPNPFLHSLEHITSLVGSTPERLIPSLSSDFAVSIHLCPCHHVSPVCGHDLPRGREEAHRPR